MAGLHSTSTAVTREAGGPIFSSSISDQNLVFWAFNFKFDSAIIEISDAAAEPSLACHAAANAR